MSPPSSPPENASGCQNVSFGMKVPDGNEQYLYLTRCGALLGPWTCRNVRKWNCRQAHKGRFCSTVCWIWSFLGVSRQNIRRKIKRCMKNQHLVLWRGPCSTHRQAQELISGPDLATRARLLSFNRTQSRAVIGLLTGQNTLRRHLYNMGLSNNPICRECGAEKETSVHILCECEVLVSLRHI